MKKIVKIAVVMFIAIICISNMCFATELGEELYNYLYSGDSEARIYKISDYSGATSQEEKSEILANVANMWMTTNGATIQGSNNNEYYIEYQNNRMNVTQMFSQIESELQTVQEYKNNYTGQAGMMNGTNFEMYANDFAMTNSTNIWNKIASNYVPSGQQQNESQTPEENQTPEQNETQTPEQNGSQTPEQNNTPINVQNGFVLNEITDYINKREQMNPDDIQQSDYNFWLEITEKFCKDNNIKAYIENEDMSTAVFAGPDGKYLSLDDIYQLIDNGIPDDFSIEMKNRINIPTEKLNKKQLLQEIRDMSIPYEKNVELRENLMNNLKEDNLTTESKPEPDRSEIVDDSDWAILPWIKDLIEVGFDGLFGILLYPLKLIIIALAGVFNLIIQGIGSIGGAPTDGVSLASIIYTTGGGNGVPIVSIDFFNTASGNSSIDSIRTGIAQWFYAFRNLSIIISLAVLIYIGIRMAISSIAEDKSKYKSMLINWVVQMILIYVMQYIIIFTININNALVGVLGTSANINGYAGYMSGLLGASISPTITIGFGSAIIYCILLGITFSFLIVYIKRMITIGFLVIISPLVTVTYAIDKVGDSRSQAMNTWLKEFVYNVLIQPFHCIIYAVFVTTSMGLLNSTSVGNFGAPVLAIICIMFMLKAEDILRKIFAFDKNASSLGSSIASAALLGAGIQSISSMFKKEEGTNKKGNNNEQLPDLAAIRQNQAVQQVKNNEEEPHAEKNNLENQGKAVTAAEIARRRRSNIREERRKERGGVVGTAVNLGKEFTKKTIRAGLPMFAAFTGLGTGDLKNALAAGSAGYAIERGIEGKAKKLTSNEKENSRIAKSNEKVFAEMYSQLETEWTKKGGVWEGLSKEEIVNKHEDYAKKDLESFKNKAEREYAEIVRVLVDSYGMQGYNNPMGSTKQLVRKTQNQNIKKSPEEVVEQIKNDQSKNRES